MITFKRGILLLVAGVLALGSLPLQAQNGLSSEEIQRIAQSVVMILNIQNNDIASTGSGTIVSPDGLIFTNRHVIEDADELAILMLDDINEQPVLTYFAHEVASYEDMDFAILQIDRDSEGNALRPSDLDLPFLQISDHQAERGERIYVFGYPGIGDGYLVLTDGTITTVQNGTIGNERIAIWYQTDAEISPGNSGGLAINYEGELLGIPSAVQFEDETAGRLGGILPFPALMRVSEVGTPIRVSNTPAGSPGTVAGGDSAIECEGSVINNGIELLVHRMNAGLDYVITAIGVGLDPVLVVRDPANPGDYICSDDNPEARTIEVDLPGAGRVSAGRRSAQLRFSHNTSSPIDISIVVGSKDDEGGEIILILEGMTISQDDGVGDGYTLRVTSQMLDSGIPLDAYMIGVDRRLDPLLILTNERLDDIILDSRGDPIYCENAGTNNCWRNSESLEDRAIINSNGDSIAADNDDAMFFLNSRDIEGDTLTFLATSYELKTTGSYMLVFHIGLR